jgi:hypothetical protein
MLQLILMAFRGIYLLLRAFFSTFFTRIWAFVLFALPHILEKILKYLGIGIVSYVGFDILIGKLKDVVFERFNSIPVDILSILQLAKVDKGLAILFASMTIAMTIKLATKSASLVKQGSMNA